MNRDDLLKRICPNACINDCRFIGCTQCNEKLNEWFDEYDKQIRADIIDELYNKIDEGVCDICEHKDFESDCFKTCKFEVENAKKWLLSLKEQNK